MDLLCAYSVARKQQKKCEGLQGQFITHQFTRRESSIKERRVASCLLCRVDSSRAYTLSLTVYFIVGMFIYPV